jgi:hypothetical protein
MLVLNRGPPRRGCGIPLTTPIVDGEVSEMGDRLGDLRLARFDGRDTGAHETGERGVICGVAGAG